MLLRLLLTAEPVYTTGQQVILGLAALGLAVLGLWIKDKLSRRSRRYR